MALQARTLLARAVGIGGVAMSATTGGVLLDSPAKAAATSFSCTTSKGVPATVAKTDDGRIVSMIRWTSNAFDGAGWTPQRRCQEVSQRFETYRQQGRLAYITTGRMNSLPVICTARSDGGACDGLLYTLKPGQDPTLALKRLFDVRFKARGPLNETTSRVYLSVNELLGAPKMVNPAANTNTSTSDVKPLW